MPAVTSRPRRVWVLPVIAVVIALTAVGGLAARQVYQRPVAQPSPMPIVLPPTTSTTTVPSAEPGSGTVKLTTDAAAYPLSSQVQPLLQDYFDGINQQRYDLWRNSVTASRAAEQPESKWRQGYDSVKDGSIIVYRIDLAPQGGLRVLLTFTSTQDVDKAPPEFRYPCIRWQVIWALSLEHGKWKLDTGTSGETPQHEQC